MDPVTERTWVPRGEPPAAELVARLQSELGVDRLSARWLAVRWGDVEAAGQFLTSRLADLPDPFLLPEMNAAVSRLVVALEAAEPVAVHGDYDVDGMTGTVLLVEGLRALGAGRVDYHIPLRMRDGYGLSAEAIEQVADAGGRLILSVDCGVSAHAEAALAKQAGVDLIITDHHQPSAELPDALAVINPQRADSEFPCRDLAGVGVAFFLLVALRKRLRDLGWFATRPVPDLRLLLDLVALGTIADLVPLQGVNRVLTRTGLALIDTGSRPGLRALKQVAGTRTVSAGVVGFQLAPRLNAAGRLEDASLGVELLMAADMVPAMTIARRLDQFNRERRELEKATLQQAIRAVAELPGEGTHAIVLAAEGWHPGVIGIVASRLVELYYRPTVLIALDGDSGKGSSRSIRGFHMYRGLQQCADRLLAFGGHEMAAGLSIAQGQVASFRAAFEEAARAELDAADLVPRLRYDGDLLIEELDLEAVRRLAVMAPFGMGNPEPLFLVEEVRPVQLQVVGGQHLRFTACQGGYSHPAIAFGMAERRDRFTAPVDLLVTPQLNSYRGRETVQLRVKDIRPAGAER